MSARIAHLSTCASSPCPVAEASSAAAPTTEQAHSQDSASSLPTPTSIERRTHTYPSSLSLTNPTNKARIQELTKKLRTTLSYAHWKASHNHQTSTIAELEERYLGAKVYTHTPPGGTISHASTSISTSHEMAVKIQTDTLLPALPLPSKEPEGKEFETVWDHPELNPASSRPSSVYNELTSQPATPTRTRFDPNSSSKHHHSRSNRTHRRVPSLQTQLQLQQSQLVFPPFFTASPERKRNVNPIRPRPDALALDFGLTVERTGGSSHGVRPVSQDSAAAQIMMMFLNSGAHSPGDTEDEFTGEEEEEQSQRLYNDMYRGRKRTIASASNEEREETVEPENVKRRR